MSKKKNTKITDFEAPTRHFFASYHGANQEKEQFDQLIQSDDERVEELRQHTPPHAHLFELSLAQLLGLYFCAFGIVDEVLDCFQKPDPVQAVLDFFDDDSETSSTDDEMTIEEKGFALSVLFAVEACIESMEMHSVPMTVLIESARKGDEEALLNAVMVDRSSLGTPTINKRIRLAQRANDDSFLDRLTKAITRTRPRPPKTEFNDLRAVLSFLDDEYGLKNLSAEKLHAILVDGLELYSGDQEALVKFIGRRNKKVKDMK